MYEGVKSGTNVRKEFELDHELGDIMRLNLDPHPTKQIIRKSTLFK